MTCPEKESEKPSWALDSIDSKNLSYEDLMPPKIVKTVDNYEPTVVLRRRRSLGTLRRRYSGESSSGRRRRGSFGQPTTTTAPSKTKVRFSNPLTTERMPCTYGKLSRREVKAIWYRSRDYESFESDKKKTIQKLRLVGGDVMKLNPIKYCLRGIEEYQCYEHYSHTKRKRLEYIQRIIVEQERQRFLNVHDPNKFVHISLQYSVEQMEICIYRGQRDERHAKDVHNEGKERQQQHQQQHRTSFTSRSRGGMQRRVSQRYVPVDASPSAEVPRTTKRDSLNLTKLKGSIAAFRELMESDPELQDLLTEDDDDDDADEKSSDDNNDDIDDTPSDPNEGLSLAELCALIDDPSDDENDDDDGNNNNNNTIDNNNNNDGGNDDDVNDGDDDSSQLSSDSGTTDRPHPVRLSLNDSLSRLPHIVRQRRPGGIA